MNEAPRLPSYEEMQDIFANSEEGVTPAEWHGQLCGMLTISTPVAIPDDLKLNGVSEADLENLKDIALQQFVDVTEGLQLLLPDDEQPLSERLEALIDWTQGYLAGLSFAGLKSLDVPHTEVKEGLSDLVEITKIDKNVENNEEDEVAFFEISEHVRVVAQMMYFAWRNEEDEEEDDKGGDHKDGDHKDSDNEDDGKTLH